MKAIQMIRGLCAGGIVLLAVQAEAGDLTVDGLSVMEQETVYGPLTVQGLEAATPSNGLVLYYSFSATNATDESGSGNNGTVYGATWTTSGVLSASYNYDGTNDYIEVAGSSSLDLRSNLTLTGWVYYKGEGLGNGIVVGKKTGSSLQYAMGRYSAGYGAYSHQFFGGLDVGGYADYRAEYFLSDNQWYFLAMTYDRVNLKLYVNGTLAMSYATTALLTGDSTSRLTVGSDANAPTWNEFANAIIDEARIYNRALSSVELKQLYLSYQPGYTPTNGTLTVEGPATLKHIVLQGDIGMGGYTNGP